MTVAAAGPVFVVGSMRSGSTMLRLILDSHPNIAIPHETGFMAAIRATKDIPDWKFGAGWYERLNWTEEEIDAKLRGFYSELFQRYATQRGKQRWGEKTPFHTAHMAEMGRVFPDAVFVGILRHPGAVASSLRKNFHYTFGEAVAYWTATNLQLVRAGADLGARFTAFRYEDLVQRSEPVLRELTDFLGEPWSDNLLRHQEIQREQGAPRVAEGSTVTRDPIDAKRAGQWAEAATAEDRQALDDAAPLAQFLGYDPTDPTVQQPLGGDGSRWTVTGTELAARRGAWNGHLALDVPDARPLVEASAEELAARLAKAEGALRRVRSRRSVRVADAFRKVQRGRTLHDVRDAWTLLRGPGTGGR